MIMDLQKLTEVMNQFVREQGWYDVQSSRPQTPRNLAISLNLEVSEILEHFQWDTEPLDKSALADELADVALYLLQLASVSEIDLEEAITRKLEENRNRTWHKG